MRISTWRPGMIIWLNHRILINTWELRNPEVVGETAGFLPPLRLIKHYIGESGQAEAEATQEIYITTRYSRDFKYSELPLPQIEGVYSSLCQDLLKDHQSIVPGLDLTINPSAHHMVLVDPIQVQEYGDDLADWLVTMVFYVILKWMPEVEPNQGFGYTANNINKISLGIYRAKVAKPSDLTFNPRVLDAKIKIPRV